MTPLHWACFWEDSASIKYLLEKNAVLTYDFQDCTPTDIAGYKGHKKIVNQLLQHFLRNIDLEEYENDVLNSSV